MNLKPTPSTRGSREITTIDSARRGTSARASWSAQAGDYWRALSTPQQWFGNMPAASATFNAQFWADASPLRLTAGWVLLAGLFASGVLQRWQTLDGKEVLLLWLLVDLLWGALWRLAGGRTAILGLGAGPGDAALRLPFMQPNSPAGQLLSLDQGNSLPYLVRVALPTLLVAVVVSAALGIPALVSTLALVIVTVGGWILRRTVQTPPLLLHAVAMVLLPWMLALVQFGMAPGSAGWTAALTLGLLWTVHAWAEARVGVWHSDNFALWLMAVAQAGLLLLLVINKTPLWAPIVAILLLPTWLRTMRKQPLGGLSAWWLAAFLASALALGWN